MFKAKDGKKYKVSIVNNGYYESPPHHYIHVEVRGYDIADGYFFPNHLIFYLDELGTNVFNLQNKGIGREAIKTICDYILKYCDDFVFLAQPNLHNGSVGFYKKCGFEDLNSTKVFKKTAIAFMNSIVKPWDDDARKMMFLLVKKKGLNKRV